MILLDTNVISELMKSVPSSNVIEWIDQQQTSDLFITTITIAEISYGLSILPEGNRRNALEAAFNKVITHAFLHRILDFDTASAYAYGKIMSIRKKMGRPMSVPDGQIAAIAESNRLVIATCNIHDFCDCGFDLINPFSA